MTFYPAPDVPTVFSPGDELRDRVKISGSHATALIQHWMDAFDSFWMTPLTHGARCFSKSEVQQMLLADPAAVSDLFADSQAFLDFLQANHAEKIGDDQLVPSRYLSTPYDVDIATMQLTSDLKPAWEAPTDAND